MKNLYLFLIPLSFGCSSMKPGEDTWESLYTPDEWKCLLDTEAPIESTGRATYTVPVVDFNSQPTAPTPVPALAIAVCTSPTCDPVYPVCTDNPLGQCVNISGGPVLYKMDFPAGLSNVVLRLSAPDYVGMDYVMGGPMVQSTQGLGIPMVPIATRQSIYTNLGAGTVDETRGVLAVRTLDCNNARAQGVTVEAVDGQIEYPSIPFRLSNNNLATGATLETDERGVAGFVNLAPQTVDVVARTDYGKEFGGPTTLNIRPNTITLAELRDGIDIWGQ